MPATSMIQTVSAADVKNRLEVGGDTVVLNVLSKEKFDAMHIPGSVNIPLDELRERIEREVPSKDTELIVYCADENCNASPQAAEQLVEMGYRRVRHFPGGLAGWEEAGNTFSGVEA